MDTLPIELVTLIATDTFELFTTLLRVSTIGNRLCEQYPQLIAKEKFIVVITDNEKTITYLNGKLHSLNDQPAIVDSNGNKLWYKYGKLHRRDLPAAEYTNGDKEWYWHDELHRDCDLPAVIRANDSFWYWHGKLHRENDQPAIISAEGVKYWCWNNGLHRDCDLPAIEFANGKKCWYKHSVRYFID